MNTNPKFIPLAIAIILIVTFIPLIIIYDSLHDPDPESISITEMKPFPTQAESQSWSIVPSHISSNQTYEDVKATYDDWADTYMKPYGSLGKYYVDMEGVTETGYCTTSEATGYGMIINVLMAGYGGKHPCKTYFDGLLKLYQTRKSTRDHRLMSWIVPNYGSGRGLSDSATDGDMDIAYALILADLQWNDTTRNYRSIAEEIIDGIVESTITKWDCNGTMKYRLELGDWVGGNKYQYGTRLSDWVLDHLILFNKTNPHKSEYLSGVISDIYTDLKIVLDKHTTTNALVPDFAWSPTKNSEIHPVGENYLESDHDPDYNYNSCRFPWRMTVQALHNNDSLIRSYLNNFTAFLKPITFTGSGYDFTRFKAGYYLNGTAYADYDSAAFISPAISAAICNESNQDFLNNGWDYMKNVKDDIWSGYYEKSLNLLCMLIVSNCWWSYS